MPTQIEVLAALQVVDQALRQKQQAAEDSERRVAALEDTKRQKGAEVAAAREELATHGVRQRDLEGRLAVAESKLRDRRMRITRIRNEKELGLAKREVELLKEETNGLETELVEVMEKVETAGARVKALDEELEQVNAALETEAVDLRQEIGTLGSEIAQERARRDALVGSVDEELHRRYEMIFSRRGGLAVVEIRGGTCLGCHMNVPPQLFNQIQRMEQVILCPNCQRMLFWRADRVEEANGE